MSHNRSLVHVFKKLGIISIIDVHFDEYYNGDGNQEIVGAKPHFTRNLIDLAVKDDHLSTEGFERSQAKVAMLEKSR